MNLVYCNNSTGREMEISETARPLVISTNFEQLKPSGYQLMQVDHDGHEESDSSSDSLATSSESAPSSDVEYVAIRTLLLLNQKRKLTTQTSINSNNCSSYLPPTTTTTTTTTSCSQPIESLEGSQSTESATSLNEKGYQSDPEADRRSSATGSSEYSRKRKIYKYCDERERRENKRDQNKEAAKRYREKKKTEAEKYFKEMNELEAINRKRKQRIKELEREKTLLIQNLKGVKH